jgi:hypothetical protein
VLCLLPFAAHGLRWWATTAVESVRRGGFAVGASSAGIAVLGVAVAIGCGIALTGGHSRRSQEIGLARWIGRQVPSARVVAADPAATRIGYAIAGALPRSLMAVTPETIDRELGPSLPDVLVFSIKRAAPANYEAVVARATSLGMRRVDSSAAPGGSDFAVLVRSDAGVRAPLRTADVPTERN